MECARYVLMTLLRPSSPSGLRGWSALLVGIATLTAATAAAVRQDGAGLVSSARRQQPSGLHYAVDEELPVGTRVADIVADAGLHRHGVDALTTMSFRLLNQPTGGLVVGETTGVLSVGSRLDREQLCPSVDDDTCQIRLDVAVQPMAYFQIIKVRIFATVIMRPSSVGGGRNMRRTLSVCLSVRPSRARMYFVYICTVLRAHIQNRKTSVFAHGPA